jgi:hypothetical protein
MLYSLVDMIKSSFFSFKQCFVSGSGFDPRSIMSVNPDPDWEVGYGSRQAEVIPEEMEKLRNYFFIELSARYLGFLEPERRF